MIGNKILITCEHASNKVLKGYNIPKKLLNTHEAYDINSLYVAKRLSKLLGSKLIVGTMTRLIVDLNRKKPKSKFFKVDEFLIKYHREWRQKVINDISKLHISVHTFTPVFNAKKRNADLGLLYDPSRKEEKKLCALLKKNLDGYVVKMNYPYKGISDGLTTSIRKVKKDYVGIELEFNQNLSEKKMNDMVIKISEVLVGYESI